VSTEPSGEELREALTRRSTGKSVGRTYGVKKMLERWDATILTKAVSKISYPGLDLSRGLLRFVSVHAELNERHSNTRPAH
jgi:hypothetical protein